MTQTMVWRHHDKPLADRRLLVFSPVYPVGHEMRYRIVDSNFLHLMGEVTYWAYLDDMEPKEA